MEVVAPGTEARPRYIPSNDVAPRRPSAVRWPPASAVPRNATGTNAPSPRPPMRPVQPQINLPPDGCHFTLFRDGRRVILHARHRDQAAALSAFRRLEGHGQCCVVVRLD